LLICGLSMIVTAVAIGPSIALRALGRGDLLLRVMRVQSPVILGLAVAGALWSGVDGAAAGFALAQVVGAVALWVLFLRAARITT
jgi:Na+-driven multidrug efflux pump